MISDDYISHDSDLDHRVPGTVGPAKESGNQPAQLEMIKIIYILYYIYNMMDDQKLYMDDQNYIYIKGAQAVNREAD